jgi:hypothetical protein
MCKQNCLGCHFFSVYGEHSQGHWKVTVTKKERKAKNSRGNFCFYRKFEDGMLLSAAEELEKRETMQAEANADRKCIRRGVWATFATAIATLIAAILGSVLTYYFQLKLMMRLN